MNFLELKNKLQQPYDQSNWVEWLQDIFGLQMSIDSSPDTLIIEKGNAKSVHRFASLQMSDDRHIAILDIVTSYSVLIARNRVALRDIVFKLIDQDKYHGLLVFYHSEDVRQSDYRLSFISSQSTFDSEGNFITQSTHPKRYSFLLGPNESCYTAAQRLKELKNKVPPFKAFQLQKGISLQDLQDAFSVEKLNKEFFKQYKEVHYTKFWQYIASHESYADLLLDHKQQDQDKKEKPIRDWVKKMLGRIVFLHFLQKKGWMACPSDTDDWIYGDQSFMYNLFDRCPHQNHFYSKVLIPLFFKTLNSRRSGDLIPDVFSYYLYVQITKHDNVDNLKIPYLNGGLFENVDQQCNKIDFPSEYFADLLEFFQQYNFTIDENSPDEQEVGIDPEMLGHIFENLLEENKDKGAFYTPKEIVHYMCQESLIEYLRSHLPQCKEDDAPETIALHNFIRNDEIGDRTNSKNYIVDNAEHIEQLLDQVKICDPAIGSGAFPMGMLQEIFKAKMTLDLTQDKVAVKKGIIQNSIYGVDLESGAVDIARLRFWLSLVVDEDKPEPLPNLDYKIMQGNSLLESYEGIDLSKVSVGKDVKVVGPEKDLFGNLKESQMKMTFSDSKISQEVQKLIQLYFSIEIAEQKATTKDKINKAVFKHIDYNIELRENQLHRWMAEAGDYNNLKKNAKKKYDQWINDLNTLEKTKINLIELQKSADRPFFLWHLFFADVFSNGGFDIVIGNPPYIKERDNAETFKIVNESNFGAKWHQGKMDYWFYFLHKGMDVVQNDGVITFITSRYWLNSQGAKKLIERIQNELSFCNVVDIGKLKVFDNVAGHHMVAIYKKAERESFKCKFVKNDISSILSDTENENVEINYLDKSDVFRNGFEITLNKPFIKLKESSSLGSLFYVSQGVVEAPDKISSKQYKKNPDPAIVIGDGVFVLSKDELDRIKPLSSNLNEFDLIKKYIAPYSVSRYYIASENHSYLIYSDSITKFIIANNPSYSWLKDHLDKFKDFITSSNKPYGLHRARKIKYFDNPKIVFKGMFSKPEFAIDYDNLYFGLSFLSIIEKENTNYSLKFLLALLNSSLAETWFYTNGKLRGVGVDIGVEKLRSFPIPKITHHHLFETLVDYMNYLSNPLNTSVNEYESNSSISNIFQDVLNMMVVELYFSEQLQESNINVLQFIDPKNYFIPISNHSNSNIGNIIGNCYSWLQQENNPIRNRIMLGDVRSKDIIGRINSATH